MAKIKATLKKIYEKIPDWIWPHETGETEPAPTAEFPLDTDEIALITATKEVINERLAQVDERIRNVETKLIALLALASVLSAVITAGLGFTTTMNGLADYPQVPMYIAMLFVFYISINLICSLLATVKGLKRRDYKQLILSSIMPKQTEDEKTYKIRINKSYLSNMQWNEWVINKKVTQMAIAHVALRNVLFGAVGVILSIVAIVSIQALTSAPPATDQSFILLFL